MHFARMDLFLFWFFILFIFISFAIIGTTLSEVLKRKDNTAFVECPVITQSLKGPVFDTFSDVIEMNKE